ncbi:VWA domain-containing protein [Photobacterium sp. DNB22_13_2]
MVNFFAPLWLLGLLVAPVLFWLKYHRRQQDLIAPHLQQHHFYSRNRTNCWITLAWVVAMVAMAGPHWREQDRPQSEHERARVIVMDMSQAMYAQDISPSRFQQAFYKISDLINLIDEGYIALVAYSNEGYTISPLTHDNNTVLTHIEHLSPDVMPSVGKNAAAGVKEAITLLEQTHFGYGDILLVTSGISDTEGTQIADALRGTPYTLSTYAISTTQGAEVYDENGKPHLGSDDQPVISRLVPERLSALSAQTGGISLTYQHSQQDIEQLYGFLTKIRNLTELAEQSEGLSSQFINDGYWLLWPLAGMLLFAFRRGVIWSIGLVLLVPASPVEANELNQIWSNADRQGYKLYQQQNYQDAANTFVDPAWLGVALYETGDYQGAIEAFSQVTDKSSDYNTGNALAKLGRLEEAAVKYRDVIEGNPDHQGAKFNLGLVEGALQALENQNFDNQEQGGEAGDDGNSDEEENGDSDGDEERDDKGSDDNSGGQDNLETDPDTENVPEQQGESENTGSDSQNNQSDNPQFSPDSGGDFHPPQQQSGESGEYDADEFTAGATDLDFGTPTEDDIEAIRHQLSELGEINPVLNRLTQIQDDRTLLLKNLLLLQAALKEPSEQTEIEW